jgi:hypothetical protein
MRSLVVCGLLAALVGGRCAFGQDRGPRLSGGSSRGFGHAGQHDHGGHHHGGHHHSHRRGHSHFWFDLGFPGFWGGGYAPAFDWYLPSYSTFGYVVVVPPPTVVNVPPAAAPAPAAVPANNPPAAIDAAADPPAKAQPRVTNAEHKARAGRFVGFGNASFAKQKYLAALERYKTATAIAPDVAESYFRQGAAHVALGQYASAARTFRRGLKVRSDWAAAPFRLDELYDDAPLPKTHHLEDLARAVEANPLDAELMLVLGMELYLDGRIERARVFFARSAQLSGNEDQLLDAFLDEPKPDGAAGAQPQGGKISF